ncbi:hypothetical protein LINGRAHAP2_LOCUS6012 [Linum grandiflorum]
MKMSSSSTSTVVMAILVSVLISFSSLSSAYVFNGAEVCNGAHGGGYLQDAAETAMNNVVQVAYDNIAKNYLTFCADGTVDIYTMHSYATCTSADGCYDCLKDANNYLYDKCGDRLGAHVQGFSSLSSAYDFNGEICNGAHGGGHWQDAAAAAMSNVVQVAYDNIAKNYLTFCAVGTKAIYYTMHSYATCTSADGCYDCLRDANNYLYDKCGDRLGAHVQGSHCYISFENGAIYECVAYLKVR